MSKGPVLIGLLRQGRLTSHSEVTLTYTYTFSAGIRPGVEVYAHYYGGNRWERAGLGWREDRKAP